jgi:hypothetical protein
MKKALIGALVGGIILFAWQSISWTVTGIHDDGYRYVPNQDAILDVLSKNLPAEGQYMVPRSAPGVSSEEEMQYNEQMNGKPWAVITYHSSFQFNMVTPIIRGFLICFVSALLACWIIRRFDPAYKTFISIFSAVLSFGVICFVYVWYTQRNWFHTPWDVLWGELIDNLVSWALCGVWLGWWYSRGNKPKLTM